MLKSLWVISAREPKRLLRKEKKQSWAPLFSEAHHWHFQAAVCIHHVSAGTGKRHVSGVKLQRVDGSWVFPIQHRYLHPTLCAPNMHPPVFWTCRRQMLFQKNKQTNKPHTHIQSWSYRKTRKYDDEASYQSWQTVSLEWSRPPVIFLYCCCSPSHKQNLGLVQLL